MTKTQIMPLTKSNLKLLAIIFLLFFAIIQYLLILRHKSPYLSDSYFFRHQYLQLKGVSFNQAYNDNLTKIDFNKADEISSNIFRNPETYNKAFNIFSKRKLYPYFAYLIDKVINNDYISFLLPVFISYIGTIFLLYRLSSYGVNDFFALFAMALLIAFYPFLDWSTYFLADILGTFLWFTSIYFVYNFTRYGHSIWVFFFSLSFFLSLLNREQNLLILPLLLFAYILSILYKSLFKIHKKLMILIISCLVITIGYFLAFATGKGVLENFEYARNSFGYYSYQYSLTDNLLFSIKSFILSNKVLIIDLTRHHWWFAFTLLGILGIIKTLIIDFKKIRQIDLVMVSSAIAAYLVMFWPVLGYRYLFPAIISLIYFASKLIQDYQRTLEDPKTDMK